MMVGQWCAIQEGAHATVDPGDRDTAGSLGGWTVHAPSPMGEGISSLPLTSQCLPLGLFVSLVPNLAPMQKWSAKATHNQPEERLLHGPENQRSGVNQLTPTLGNWFGNSTISLRWCTIFRMWLLSQGSRSQE